jgi:hypothetical protein
VNIGIDSVDREKVLKEFSIPQVGGANIGRMYQIVQ